MTNEFTKEQELWIQTLESGNYNQTTRNLWKIDQNNVKGYCCLGVAMEMFDSDSKLLNPTKIDCNRSVGSFATGNTKDLLKLYHHDGKFRYSIKQWESDVYFNITHLNDVAEFTFKQIASFIRKYPWMVFTNFSVPENISDRLTIDQYELKIEFKFKYF